MNEWKSWIACVVAGVVTALMVAFIFPLFPADAAGDIAPYPSPVYAFEYARTPADLIAVFGDAGDPERIRRMDAMDLGNRWDFLFMTVYSAFGALFGWAIIRSGLRGGLLILIAAIAAGIADIVETRTLLSITASLRDGQNVMPALDALRLPVVAKFTGIGIVIIAAGSILMNDVPGTLWKATGFVAFLSGFITLSACFGASYAIGAIGTSVGLGWLAMLAFAARQAWVGRSTPPRRPHP